MINFGTDGIRGKADALLADGVGYALGRVLSQMGKRICVARDTRLSSPKIERQLVGGLLEGADVTLCGIIPTPALAYMARDYDYSVMITASHNPPEYNGLKVFGGGEKLSVDEEKLIADGLNQILRSNNAENLLHCTKNTARGYCATILQSAKEDYVARVANSCGDLSLRGRRVYLDCAWGCSSVVAKEVFERRGATVVSVNDGYNGEKVNVGCGSTHVENFAKIVPVDGIGFAFDGDGDRVIAVVNGKVYDGDQILFALARAYDAQGKLDEKCVVGTIMTGGGIEKECASCGISLYRSDVGDKNVFAKMIEVGAILGGERSGHVILLDKGLTGDGIQTALALTSAEQILGGLPHATEYEVKEISIVCDDPKKEFAKESCQVFLEKIKQIVGQNGRLIARPSGTENKIRISVEVYNTGLEYLKIAEMVKFYNNR